MQLATQAFDRHVLTDARGDRGTLAARALFNAVRFGLAAGLYLALTHRRQRNFARADVLGGITVGAFFATGMLLQVTGLRWTVPSVSAFLTALAVGFAPLGQAAILGRKVGGPTWLAVGFAMAGMVLLSWPRPQDAAAAHTLAIAPPLPGLGEICTAVAAVLFTAQILAVDRFGQRADAARLTFVMLTTTAALSLIAGALIGGASLFRDPAALARDRQAWWSIGSLVVASSVLALHLMNTYQPRVSPATASVVYCTEPIFATAFSVALATERLTPLTVAGGAAVFGAVLIVATHGTDPKLPAEGHLGQ
jgi:drug/metabolite transporter (DMT)-like permease